jgi:hypothetical protein
VYCLGSARLTEEEVGTSLLEALNYVGKLQFGGILASRMAGLGVKSSRRNPNSLPAFSLFDPDIFPFSLVDTTVFKVRVPKDFLPTARSAVGLGITFYQMGFHIDLPPFQLKSGFWG